MAAPRETDGARPTADLGDAAEVSARLARLERQFAEVQRLASLGSWEWDIRADRVTWSDELYRIYGLRPGEFAATYEAFLERIHPEDRELVDRTVQEAYATRRAYAFDHRLVRPDGSVRWLHGRGNVVVDEHGEPVRLYGVAIDITERKRAEQFLRAFLHNAAHELRTPVAAITHTVELLTDPAVELDEATRGALLGTLRRQVDRLRHLATELGDLSALESGASVVMLEPVPLAPAVAVAAASIPTREGITVDVQVPPELVVRAGREELTVVFRQLLDNAVRYAASRVVVRGWGEGGEVLIQVADDGPGVAPGLLPDLFAPFARGDPAGAGVGLGLAIVRRLVTAFGGQIDYVGADGGACFQLRLEEADAQDPAGRG